MRVAREVATVGVMSTTEMPPNGYTSLAEILRQNPEILRMQRDDARDSEGTPVSAHHPDMGPPDALPVVLPEAAPAAPVAPPAPPTELTELDRLRLVEASLRVETLGTAIAQHAKAHNEAVADRERWNATLTALSADLRTRYALAGNAKVDLETGAIVRG